MNGQLIDLSGDLPALIGMGRPGDIVALDVWHYGARRTIRAQLDDADVTAVRHADAAVPAPQGRLGLALRPLQPDERRASQPGGRLVGQVRCHIVQRGAMKLYVPLRLS